ncbi:hypothetical protein MMC16_004154 [Acarospora aff. strigata]|nr:hypothetical protein [Acarospora aff. strigata]
MIPRSFARHARLYGYSKTTSLLPYRNRLALPIPARSRVAIQTRHYAAKTEADVKIEDLQELYATAKDEFEIASEETEKKTVYAADDRAAAQEELAKLKTAFDDAVRDSSPDVSAEIKSRVGQRIRELDRAVEAMEQAALEE